MTPQLVWAKCENAHQFVLWSVIKMVAGEEGTCILGTRDLAALAMLGVGTVHQARQDLLRLGLLEGELCRDPGYPNAVWHLRIPDLWAANHAWRKAHPSLRERIEYKRAHKEGAHEEGVQTEPAPPGETESEWPPRSTPEGSRSAPERDCSGGESRGSGDECAGSAREPKDIPIIDPTKKQGGSLDTAWKNALAELELQLPGQVYSTWILPLRPGGWHPERDCSGKGPDGSRAVLLCPNPYVQEWCRERLGVAIQRVLGGILGRPGLEIEYRLQTTDDGRWTTFDGRPLVGDV